MITAIIPTRNDPMLQETIGSIIQGSDASLKMIIVNDAGAESIALKNKKIVSLLNGCQLGPAMSRHVGAQAATTDWLMFCDGHMLFPKNWYSIVCPILERANPEDVFCSVYHSDVIFDPFWHDTHLIGGADFYFWRHRDREYSFCDLSPRRVKGNFIYNVPCVLGACYFVNRQWFNSIGGFSKMTGYGSEETWLSWNSWMAGGEASVISQLSVTHRYQGRPRPSHNLLPQHQLNRLIVLRRILTPDQYGEFCSWIPIDANIKAQVDLLDISHYDETGTRLAAKRVGHPEICQQFGLQTYEEAIELMREFHDKNILQNCRNQENAG